MKRQIPVWVALTFLMFFLVLAAAFIFLLQGRFQLEDRMGDLETTVEAVSEEKDEFQLETTIQAATLADAEATQTSLEAEIDDSENQMAVLADEKAELQVEVSDAEATIVAQLSAESTAEAVAANMVEEVLVPSVMIVSPEDGLTVRPGEEVEIIVSATDAEGVVSLNLTLNEESLGTYETDDEPLFTAVDTWQAEEEGEYVFEALAVGATGQASEPVLVTINVLDIEERLRGIVEEVQEDVEDLRDLEAIRPITLTILSTDELRVRVETDFLEDVTEEETFLDTVELYAFDFVDLDLELYDILVDLYSGSILGFYDLETSELVVVSDDADVSPREELTLAHEIVHALQDQLFEFDLAVLNSEASFALRSLAEGDATLLQSLYIREGIFTSNELSELFDEFNDNGDAPDFSAVPTIILNQQAFPYNTGVQFVETLYLEGGFDAVDAAWENPPVSTEHIMNPETYLAGDLPIEVSLPALTPTLGTEWQFVDQDTLGQFFIQEYLVQEVSESSARRAAAGWGGDAYVVHWNENDEELLMAMQNVWDTEEDSNEFITIYTLYLNDRHGADGIAQDNGSTCWISDDVFCLYQAGLETLVVRGPDPSVVLSVVEAIGGFGQ